MAGGLIRLPQDVGTIHSMPPRDRLAHIENLREHRGLRTRDTSIQGLLSAQAEQAQRQAKRFGQIADLWQQIIPERLVTETVIESLNRGVLTVGVPSAAVRYNLEERLRGGLLDQLRRAYPGSLHKVKVRILAPEAPTGEARR